MTLAAKQLKWGSYSYIFRFFEKCWKMTLSSAISHIWLFVHPRPRKGLIMLKFKSIIFFWICKNLKNLVWNKIAMVPCPPYQNNCNLILGPNQFVFRPNFCRFRQKKQYERNCTIGSPAVSGDAKSQILPHQANFQKIES